MQETLRLMSVSSGEQLGDEQNMMVSFDLVVNGDCHFSLFLWASPSVGVWNEGKGEITDEQLVVCIYRNRRKKPHISPLCLRLYSGRVWEKDLLVMLKYQYSHSRVPVLGPIGESHSCVWFHETRGKGIKN